MEAARALVTFMTGPEWSTKLAWSGSNPGNLRGFKTSWMKKRLETIRALAEAGVPVGVMTAPLIPALNDDEMETILAAAAEAGATSAGYTLLRLPLEIKDLFREWLEAHAPDGAFRNRLGPVAPALK